MSPTTVANNVCPKVKSDVIGKPAFDISAELFEDFLSLGFSYTRISEMLGVSRWTVSRGMKDSGLEDFKSFSKLSDDKLDKVVWGYIVNGYIEQQITFLDTTVFKGKDSQNITSWTSKPITSRPRPSNLRTSPYFSPSVTIRREIWFQCVRYSNMVFKAKQ